MVGGSGTTSRHSDAAGAGAADAGAATAIRVLDAGLSISEALCDALCAGVGVGVGAGVGAGAAAAEPGVPSAAGGRTHRFDFSRTMVLVPGGRLAGALSRRLLARAKAACEPLFAPMIVTPKRFGPNLVAPTRPFLGDVAALFSWREVLDRSIAAKDGFAARVAALFGMPEEPDPRVRMRIARRVCRLSAEVAASMGSLQSIATSAAARDAARARGDLAVRLEVLAEFERRRTELLVACGCVDRDESIRDGVRAGRVVADGLDRVVVLFADPDPVQRELLRLLRARGVRVEVCVHRPDDVDDEGFPIAARWEGRAFPTERIRDAAIRVADRPNGAAKDVIAAIRTLPLGSDGGGQSPNHALPTSDELFVMAPDDETRRAVERELALAGAPAATGEARPFRATRLGTLLPRLADLIGEGSAESLAAFVRHDDVACWLAGSAGIGDAAERVSGYRAAVLVGAWRDEPVAPGPDDDQRVAGVARAYAGLRKAVLELCRPLERECVVAAWARPIREVLHTIVGDDLRGAFAGEREASIRLLDRALAELAEVPAAFASPVGCHEAIAVVLDELDTQEIRGAAEQDGVTIAGWLDAGMADEPHLVLAGFVDGVVPSGSFGDALIPDELRAALGMPSTRRHTARDAWILDGILTRASARAGCPRGASVTFVVPRQSEEGDPLKPSRFLLRVEDAALADRVTLLFASDSGDQRSGVSSSDTATAGFVKTPPIAGTVIESIGVTAFKAFLTCPYLFQLQSDRRLRLGDLDERATELDSRSFGTLVHSALERWGREEAARARPTEDAGAIERSALEHLDRFVAAHYPKSRVPALRVQIELARRRLRRFAEIQAEQALQGWKVHLIELSFAPGASEEDGGAIESPRLPTATGLYLKGRIDRVDRNMGTGAFRAVDYKTAATADPPTKTHVRGGKRKKSTGMIEWKDLQLPLYRVLLRSMPEPVVVGPGDLGYINLAPSAEKSGFAMFDPKVVLEHDLDAAEELAIEIVGAIQRGEFTPSGRIPVAAGDPLGAIWGRGQRGLVDAAGEEGGEE